MRNPTVEIAGTMIAQTLVQRGISAALTAANGTRLATPLAPGLYSTLASRLGPTWAARLVGNPATAASGAALGRLNLVLAGVQLASFATTLAFSSRAISQGDILLDQWRTSLAGGSIGDRVLLGTMLFVDPFTHGAQTSMAAGMAPELRADMDRQELSENLPRVMATLQGAWRIALEAPPEGDRITADYLRGNDVVSTLGPLAEQLTHRIDFTNQVDTTSYNVVAGVPSDGGGVSAIPIQRAGAREADAFEWLTTGEGHRIENQEQLNTALHDTFGIQDPQEFMTRVTMRNLQDQIGQLAQIEPGIPPNPNHVALRAAFDEQGRLHGDPHDRNTLNTLAGFLAGGDSATDINSPIAALRQATRLKQIVDSSPDEEHLFFQPADVAVGLISIDAHGQPHINRENPVYLALHRANTSTAQKLVNLLPNINPPARGSAPAA